MKLQSRLPRGCVVIDHDHLHPKCTFHMQRRNSFIAKVLEQNSKVARRMGRNSFRSIRVRSHP